MIDTLVGLYNARYHTSIKMTPKEDRLKKNEKEVYKNLYGDLDVGSQASKFKVNERVRINKRKNYLKRATRLDALK